MAGILVLLLIAGLFLWLIWYLFFRSLLWVAEPLIEYFEGRKAKRFSIEDIDKDKIDNVNSEGILGNK
jgi:biopolymer transport protein ExbB/TolQ